MAEAHIVIRQESYVGGTRERPEVGVFTQTHSARPPVPWGRIRIGDLVWMKWSGGPIVATARVQGLRQIANCNPTQLRAMTTEFKLHSLDAYWNSLPPTFFGMTIYLENEQWLDEVFIPDARSRGESWIVLDKPELEEKWLKPAEVKSVSASDQGRKRGTRTISLALRFEVLRRDNFCCTYCGRRPPEVILHIDHFFPWAPGGKTVLENLRTACSECNLGKGAKILE